MFPELSAKLKQSPKPQNWNMSGRVGCGPLPYIICQMSVHFSPHWHKVWNWNKHQHWNLWHRYDVLGWLTFIVYSIGITAIARDYKVHISYLGEKHEIRPLIHDSLHLTFWKYFQLLIRFRRHLKVKL